MFFENAMLCIVIDTHSVQHVVSKHCMVLPAAVYKV